MMNKKAMMATASIVVCSAVWVPQAMKLVKGDEPSNPATSESIDAAAMDPALSLLREMSVSPPAGKDPLSRAESFASGLESFSGGGVDVTALVQALALGAQVVDGREAVGSGGEEPLAEAFEAEAYADAEDEACLLAWAGKQELSGLLVSGERALALLGHRVVRAGDRVAGGRVRITAIESTGIALRCGKAEGWIELPPFVAHRTSSTEDTTGEATAIDEAPDGVDGEAGL